MQRGGQADPETNDWPFVLSHPHFLQSIHDMRQESLDGFGMASSGPKISLVLACGSTHVLSSVHLSHQPEGHHTLSKALLMPGLALQMVAIVQECQQHL